MSLQRAVASTTGRRPARAGSLPLAASALRRARRARNHEDDGRAGVRRCECARPGCRATFPATGTAYRRSPEQFVVVPDHAGGDVVVAAADRFFIVEPCAAPAPQASGRARPVS